MARRRAREFDLLAAPPRVVLANFYPFARGQSVGPFQCESSFFLLIVRGRGTIQIGPRSFALSSGQAVHVPWASPVTLQADQKDPLTVLSVHLTYAAWSEVSPGAPRIHMAGVDQFSATLRKPSRPQLYTDAFLVNIPLDSPLTDIASDIAHTYEEGMDGAEVEMREARLRGLALAFVAEFNRCKRAGAHDIQSQANAAQVRMVREIASFMGLSLSNPEHGHRSLLAARAGVSEATLARAFRAVTGQGPIEYLIGLRLSHAKQALRTSRAKVGEIAAQVGIPNIYYFSKLFKQRVGCSPLEYRTRLKI